MVAVHRFDAPASQPIASGAMTPAVIAFWVPQRAEQFNFPSTGTK
ncbi:hypothetical protein ACFU8Q_23425 [Streptomyces sp. NPDC057543]